jgi:basic amino acid/polyamine antiporter, APA family
MSLSKVHHDIIDSSRARLLLLYKPTLRLERVIGVGGLSCSAINCIVGSGIFGLPGIAAAMLGPAAVLAYLLCAVLMGLVGLCFAEVGSRVTGAGGLYAYATEAFGPVVGGIAGTLVWVANSVAASAAVASLLVDTLAVTTPALATGPARAATLITIYALLAAVNIRGVRSGARLSIALAVVKLVPLVLLVAVGSFAVHASNLQWVDVPTASNVGRTAVLLFFAFMGVEGSLNASGEVSDPARTVPRAIFMTLTIVAFLYIGLQLVAQGTLGVELSGAATPLVLAATSVFGPWGRRVFVATTALSAAGFLSADMLCSPRNLHALGERGQLPAWLATVSDRFRTPAVAVAIYSLVCALVALSGSFRQLVIVSSSGTLVLYLICCLAVFPLRARNVAASGSPFRAPGGAFVPIASSAIILWMLSTLPWTELAAAALVVAVAGVAYMLQAWWRMTSSKRSAEVRVRV